jgi:hypothetical protein
MRMLGSSACEDDPGNRGGDAGVLYTSIIVVLES